MDTQTESRARQGHTAVALVVDLMFASRIRGTGTAAGVDVLILRDAGRLHATVCEERPKLVLVEVDPRLPGAADAIRSIKADPECAGVIVVGFAAHVHTDAMEAARAAGADRVMPRSAFVRELPQLLQNVL